MKKSLALLFSLCMVFCLVACGNNDTADTSASPSTKINSAGTSETDTVNTSSQSSATDSQTSGTTSTETDSKNTDSEDTDSDQPVHTHTYSDATCTEAKKCSCGTTKGIALGHKWTKATCTEPKTCSVCKTTEGSAKGHNIVTDEAQHATFSVPGLSEGSHCNTCGTIIIAQEMIPALGSDMSAGTDYYEKEGQVTYRYSYSFTLYDNDRFNLTTLKIGSDESYLLTGEDGKFNYLDAGIYELKFDNGRETMYGKIVDGQFTFCNKNGSMWDEKEERPQGTTSISITPRPGNSIYGYQDLSRNIHGKSMQELYYRLYASCEAFVNSKATISAVNKNYVIDRINLDYYVLTADEAVAVWKVFLVENPRYYWLSNTVTLSGGILEVCIDSTYADANYRNQCDLAIDTMTTACASNITSSMRQLDKAMVIHDFVLEQMNYAYKEDGVTPQSAIWAHNLLGSAKEKSGVCESYAKTYQYLCRLNGLECIVVTGFNGEPHAWNQIKIDDKWYAVDCTFDETNTDAVSYNCFGINAQRMNNEYKADTPYNNGINYLYSLPKLAEHGIELVELFKNSNSMGIYANIDAAFAAMTDANGEYEIRLFRYELQGPLLLASAPVEHHINATQTPNVKSLAILGNTSELGGGYYTMTALIINVTLSLQSDMILSDLNLRGNGSLDLKSKKLTCEGESAQLGVPITGSTDSATPSELYLNTNRDIEIWNSLRVHTLRQNNNNRITLRDDVYVVKAAVLSMSFYGKNSSGQILEFCPPATNPFILIEILIELGAKLQIDKINTLYTKMQIRLSFGKIEEVGTLTLGESNTKIDLALSGQVTYVSSDLDGNDVNRRTESVDIASLTVPIATVTDRNVMNQLEIFWVNWDENGCGTHEDHTSAYILNDKNQIVLK